MRLVVVCGLLAVLLIPALARPTPVVACTGCPEPLSDIAASADRVLVGRFVAASADGSYRFRVEEALRGSVHGVITFAPGSVSDFAVGSRWILVLYPGQGLDTAVAVEVLPGGAIAPAGMYTVPTTLAAFEAWFGLPSTDTSPAPQGHPSPPWALLLAPAVAIATGTARKVRRR